MWLVAILLDSGVFYLTLPLKSKMTLGNLINFSELNLNFYKIR